MPRGKIEETLENVHAKVWSQNAKLCVQNSLYNECVESLPWLTHKDTENEVRQQLITPERSRRYYRHYFLMALRRSRPGRLPRFGSLP